VILDGGLGGGTGGTPSTNRFPNLPCPATAPTDGSSCSDLPEIYCSYSECAGSGVTSAKCAQGVWKVTRGACEAVTCTSRAGNVSLTCAAGEVCYHWNGGGAYCLPHTCGSGPVTMDCVPGATGYCYVGTTGYGDVSPRGILLECQDIKGTGY
jgi:hypothetical protein